jgi:hypothetical protein
MNRVGPESLRFVLFASAVTPIRGFLFGYDIAVINGANTFLQQHLGLDAARDAVLIGLATSAAIIGCIPGAEAFVSLLNFLLPVLGVRWLQHEPVSFPKSLG